MKVLLLLCVYIFYSCNSASVFEYGVDSEQQKIIVNKHNALRELVREGKVPNQPKGVNIKNMHWDNYLAGQAQNIANTCVYGHVKVEDARWPGVGQNIAATYDNEFHKGPEWDAKIQGWFNEYKVYHYPDTWSKSTGHYTQVVWDDTDHIGCGYAYCPIEGGQWKYMKFYVCNYGPPGNYPGPPYKTA